MENLHIFGAKHLPERGNWQIFPGRLDCSRVAGSKRTRGDQGRSFAEKVVRSDSRMFSQCWK